MFPEWTWVCGLLIGAAIGSFLNVVIYRMPLGMSLNEPKHSFCPNCKNQLRWMDLFPLFSWLVLRGKCRQCGQRVPARYFYVELITGSLWAAIWYQQFCLSSNVALGITYMLAVSALVAATYIDLAYYIIPDQLNAFLLFLGFGYNIALVALHRPEAYTWGIPSSIVGAVVGTLSLWSITFLGRLIFQKDAMGHGDIKLARGLGAFLFPMGAGLCFAVSIFAGALIGILQVLARVKDRQNPEPEATSDEEELPPESIGSILKCGLGYLLALDVIGLFRVSFYESYFGENPYSVEEIEENPVVSFTQIPFGPYLALGAIGVMLFSPQLRGLLDQYWNWVSPPPVSG